MHTADIHTHDHHADADVIDVFGFWLYIMTDCILFGCLFATFIVLNFQAAPSSPSIKPYLDLTGILIETFLLLASNFTFCLATLELYKNRIRYVQGWLALTFLLGLSFVIMEVREFARLAAEGYRWDLSGAASSFFTLVGTHGLHVSFGLLWILIMIAQFSKIHIPHILRRRMTCLGLFWNFLDIVWIFVFTIVYLVGALS